MTTQSGDSRGQLLDAGTAAFAFLEARGARLQRDDAAHRSVLVYVLPEAAFEVEYDWLEQSVFLLACRTINGDRPGGYYMHEGQRVRVHLTRALEAAELLDGARGERPRREHRRSASDAMADQLRAYAATLESCIDSLLERYERVFPTAP